MLLGQVRCSKNQQQARSGASGARSTPRRARQERRMRPGRLPAAAMAVVRERSSFKHSAKTEDKAPKEAGTLGHGRRCGVAADGSNETGCRRHVTEAVMNGGLPRTGGNKADIGGTPEGTNGNGAARYDNAYG